MSEKRKDNKNRNLGKGESQGPDGRYMYKYLDALKKPHCIYSWRLTPKDEVPAGKKYDLSLREKIRQIQKDLDDGIQIDGGKMTVLELVKKYIKSQSGLVKPTTEAGYKTVVNILSTKPFSQLALKDVRCSTARDFIKNLQKRISAVTVQFIVSVGFFVLPLLWRLRMI